MGAATVLGEPTWISYGLVARVALAAGLLQAGSRALAHGGALAQGRNPGPPGGRVPLELVGAGLVALGLWAGVAAVEARGWPLFWVGAAALLAALAYAKGPALRDRALGEPVAFLLFGPLPVLAGSLAAAGELSTVALAASLPLGFLATACALATSRRDLERDRARRVRSWATVFSPLAADRLFLLLLAAAYAWVPAGVLRGTLPWPTLLAFLALPWAGSAFVAFRAAAGEVPAGKSSAGETPAGARAVARTVTLYLLFGALYLAGWVLSLRVEPAVV